MPSPVIARADALMQRRHGASENDEIPLLTDAIDIENDLPVLVDVAPSKPAADAASPSTRREKRRADPATTPVPSLDTEWGAALVEELARRVEARLQAEIPRIIATTVAELLGEQGGPRRR